MLHIGRLSHFLGIDWTMPTGRNNTQQNGIKHNDTEHIFNAMMLKTYKSACGAYWFHDTQHDGTQHIDTQHNSTQNNDTQSALNLIVDMLSVVEPICLAETNILAFYSKVKKTEILWFHSFKCLENFLRIT